jgi:hypothetical protein
MRLGDEGSPYQRRRFPDVIAVPRNALDLHLA